MKSIGWCLEQIQIAMVELPFEINSKEHKDKAKQIIDKVESYFTTLHQLIQNPNFRVILQRLRSTPNQNIKVQVYNIDELVKDLEHMLYLMDSYLTEMREIIKGRPEHWRRCADKLVLMIDQKFGGEMGELRREFQIALHTEQELKDLITSEEHLAELLK